MTLSVSARALGGVCLLGLSVAAIAGGKIDQRNISTIPAVVGETYLVHFNDSEGTLITGKKGEKLYAHSFSFDLMKKEEISCYARSTTKVEFIPSRAKDDRDKGPRPGWKEYDGDKIKGKDKLKSCGFRGKVSDPGPYELTFLAEEPGTMRIHFFHEKAAPSKDEARALLSSAREIRAADLSGLPPMSRGHEVHMGLMPEGGEDWLQTKPEKMRPFYAALLRDGEYNAVGNFAKLGVAAMADGDYPTAEWALDHALNRIEAIYAKDDAAKAARSKFGDESIKDFKGDPYERAMAYYYRGLLYLRDGDYGNARASFATAEYQDTVSEAEEYQADFGLMNYLAGWSARCMGNESIAEDSFAAAAAIDPALAAPDPAHRTLVVAETGVGPVKVRRGKRSQMAGVVRSYDFARTDLDAPRFGNGSMLRAGDISYQATTRGGRHFDAVMNGKASFQGTMGTASDIALAGVSVLSDQLGSVGSVVGLFGGLGAGIAADKTKTHADIRYWDSLPDAVFLGTGTQRADVAAIAYSAGAPKASMVGGSPGQCQIAWVSDRSPFDAGAGMRGTPARASVWREKKDGAKARDDAMRAALMAGTI